LIANDIKTLYKVLLAPTEHIKRPSRIPDENMFHQPIWTSDGQLTNSFVNDFPLYSSQVEQKFNCKASKTCIFEIDQKWDDGKNSFQLKDSNFEHEIKDLLNRKFELSLGISEIRRGTCAD